MFMNLIDKQSKYQRIKLQQHPFLKDEVVLYLDGAWQFDTSVEFRYHESLITLPMVCSPAISNILVAGGGDGMCVREVLKFLESKVTLCELDDEMIKIFQENKGYNNGSLVDYPHRVNIVVGDALAYVDNLPEGFYYDFIALDFPSPTASNMRKGYDNLFHKDVLKKFLRVLHPTRGVLSSQVSIRTPLFCGYVSYLMQQGFNCWNYDTFYSAKGNHDSFLVASKGMLSQERSIPENVRFATVDRVASAFDARQQILQSDIKHYRLFGFLDNVEYESR